MIGPGVDRFEYLRTLERIAYGTDPADTLMGQQERYDTWFLESAAWQEARSPGIARGLVGPLTGATRGSAR